MNICSKCILVSIFFSNNKNTHMSITDANCDLFYIYQCGNSLQNIRPTGLLCWADLSLELGRVVLVRDFIGPSCMVRVVFGPSCPAPVQTCFRSLP